MGRRGVLLGGLGVDGVGVTAVLMGLVLVAMASADSRFVLARHRRQEMVLDRAFTDETTLIRHLEGLLDATVHRVHVRRVDVVNDTTTVEVRFEIQRVQSGKGWRVPEQNWGQDLSTTRSQR